jgi:hypothetical protein
MCNPRVFISGFNFSGEKTVAMLFTRKRKGIFYPILSFKGQTINYVDDHKFLGATFDKKNFRGENT